MPSFRSLLASALLASLSMAHVSLDTPKPYKFVADGRTNPVSSTGSDFPCRIPPGQSYIIDGEPTPMRIGEDQILSFSGQAVHGGGSCQLALSPGFPTKDSTWKVIHSIEGGCPARNQKGNLEGPNEDKYTFQIPDGIEPGANWTLAWTWLSRIGGGPEYYMNCAPITILPANKKRMSSTKRREALSRRADDFPELFMANMGEFAGGCTTSDAQREQISIAYPDPGFSVERPEGDNLFKQLCDGNPRARKIPANGGGNDDDGEGAPQENDPSTATISPSPSASPESSSTAAEEEPSSTPPATVDPTPTTPISSVSSPPLPPTSTPSADESTMDPPSSASPSPDSSCSCTEGYLTCLTDGTHFATCTGGRLTAPQSIAPGFKCKPGVGVGLEVSPM